MWMCLRTDVIMHERIFVCMCACVFVFIVCAYAISHVRTCAKQFCARTCVLMSARKYLHAHVYSSRGMYFCVWLYVGRCAQGLHAMHSRMHKNKMGVRTHACMCTTMHLCKYTCVIICLHVGVSVRLYVYLYARACASVKFAESFVQACHLPAANYTL